MSKAGAFKWFSGLLFLWLSTLFSIAASDDYKEITIEGQIDGVQPMTGIVFWRGSNTDTDAIALEFSYMLFNSVVKDSGVYNWSVVDEKLEDIASRGHQAIFRFRYTYVGQQTSVPEYIKAREDYNETEGISEGRTTWFPDWTCPELERFSLEFYQEFAARYDNDPRLAFVQVGFGLWGEYHIYDGPFTLGQTFPSKEFQSAFFYNLDTVFSLTPWSISIDAADDTYSPFSEEPELLDLQFGNFDDSFMHENHAGYNASNWRFFDNDRYRYSPAGGEFSYYTTYDQAHVLDLPDGAHGVSYEEMAARFRISYIIGNDQPEYQSMSRIKQAGMASGYKFRITQAATNGDTTLITIKNVGVAPIYYHAFPALNGVRSQESLLGLDAGEQKEFRIPGNGEMEVFTIECDRLVTGQEISYYGTNYIASVHTPESENVFSILPNFIKRGEVFTVKTDIQGLSGRLLVYDSTGRLVDESAIHEEITLNSDHLPTGLYYLALLAGNELLYTDRLLVE